LLQPSRNPPAHLSRNQVRSEAALKPIVRISCFGTTFAMPIGSPYETSFAERIGERVSIKRISKG